MSVSPNTSTLNSKSTEPTVDGLSPVLSIQVKNSATEMKIEKSDNVLDIVETTDTSHLLVGLMCSLVAFGGFVFGWDTGTISGFVNMDDFKSRFGQVDNDGEYYLSKVRTGLIISIFNVGCAIGGPTLSRLGEKFGRKRGLMMTMVVYIVGITVQIASTESWIQFFVGRIISGLAVGATSVLCPMFISETSPKQIRGTLVSCYQLMITAGIFLGNCTTYGTVHNYSDSREWRIPLGLCFAWAILLIIGMAYMPESPRYLIEKNKMDQAKTSISTVNKVDIVSEFVTNEVEMIYNSIETERIAGSASWGELITGKPKIFYRLFVGVMLQSLQQLSGANFFFYFGNTIFRSVGLEDSYETSIILAVVNFASTFLALYIVDHFGRRMTLLCGSAGMGACIVVFAAIGVNCLYPGEFGVNADQSTGNAMIFLACFFIFFFATTWGPAVFVVISETYPLRIRTKGIAIATSANWIWGFLITFFTPFITNAIHFAYGFVFFGCLLFSFVFVWAFVPETKGLSLEEVDNLYANYIPGLAFKGRRGNEINSDAEAEN